MRDVCSLIWLALIGLFRSRASLQAEILTLRHQLNVLRRKSPQRLTFTSIDRLVFAGLYRLAPGVLDALKIVRPETVIRWHRAGFRAYWRWKSRPRSGRPKTRLEIRQLIREISLANPLWGAPRIHGELLKLGIDAGQTTVAKYMARGRRPPSQGWKTFLHNHADGIASIDLFVVPTISFPLLYGLLLLHHDRRGRTDIGNGRSVRSGGNVLTTLSCSASGISPICCDLTRPTITRLARTFRSTRTRHRREQYMPLVAFCLRHFSADFIICTCEFEFRQAHLWEIPYILEKYEYIDEPQAEELCICPLV